MRPGHRKRNGLGMALSAAGLIVLGLGLGTSRGEEPRGLGRFFRFGGLAKPASDRPAPRPATPRPVPSPPALAPPSTGLPGPATPAPLPSDVGAGPAPRLVPHPRVSRPATESDPILTRVALGRADDGKQFGMFLQVYADGTVIDSEGVHRVGAEALRPLTEAIQAADVSRLRGHCGGPPTDFIEAVYVVVYDRALGRLRANTFSYSGNAQGCDHSVHQLHAAIEALQTKLNPISTSSTVSTASPTPLTVPEPPTSSTAPPPIPLTAP